MKKYRLQEGLTAHRASAAWKQYAGPFIASRTSKVEFKKGFLKIFFPWPFCMRFSYLKWLLKKGVFKKGVLKIFIQSAALKQEIHMERSIIREEMNKILGTGTVEEVQVLWF